MSEAFSGARKRFRKQVQAIGLGGGKLNVNVTVSFEPEAFNTARRWAKQKQYTYERDGEIGAMMMAALSAGVLGAGDYDYDFEEETDVDLDDVE